MGFGDDLNDYNGLPPTTPPTNTGFGSDLNDYNTGANPTAGGDQGGGGGGGFDLGKAAQLLGIGTGLYKTYASTRKPDFQQVPQSPEMQALRQRVLGYIDNSPTRNAIGGILSSMIQRYASGNFQLPQSGTYNPNANTTAPKFDMNAILGNIAGSGVAGPGQPPGQIGGPKQQAQPLTRSDTSALIGVMNDFGKDAVAAVLSLQQANPGMTTQQAVAQWRAQNAAPLSDHTRNSPTGSKK